MKPESTSRLIDLVEALRDRANEDRDDSALELGGFDDVVAERTLLQTAGSADEADDLIEACIDSLVEIWRRTGRWNWQAIAGLPQPALAELKKHLQSSPIACEVSEVRMTRLQRVAKDVMICTAIFGAATLLYFFGNAQGKQAGQDDCAKALKNIRSMAVTHGDQEALSWLAQGRIVIGRYDSESRLMKLVGEMCDR